MKDTAATAKRIASLRERVDRLNTRLAIIGKPPFAPEASFGAETLDAETLGAIEEGIASGERFLAEAERTFLKTVRAYWQPKFESSLSGRLDALSEMLPDGFKLAADYDDYGVTIGVKWFPYSKSGHHELMARLNPRPPMGDF
jgi:hypothetical protein